MNKRNACMMKLVLITRFGCDAKFSLSLLFVFYIIRNDRWCHKKKLKLQATNQSTISFFDLINNNWEKKVHNNGTSIMALMRNKCPKETRFFFFLEKSSNSFLSFGDYHLAESYAIHTPLPYRLYYGNLRGKRQFKIEVDGNIIESFDVYYSVKVILFGVFFSFVFFFYWWSVFMVSFTIALPTLSHPIKFILWR